MNYKTELDDGLGERNFDQDMGAVSPKRMLAYQIEREMARQNIGRKAMAEKMNTSRASLNRLLDPDNQSVTLQTIQTAADILGLNVVINFVREEKEGV